MPADSGVPVAGRDRGTPGIEAALEAACVALRRRVGYSEFADREEADAEDRHTLAIPVRSAVAAFLAAEPPADVLKALLKAQPEKTVEALTGMLTGEPPLDAGREHLPLVLGCTCRWDDDGSPPADCRCAERSRRLARENVARIVVAAAASLKPKED